MSSMESLNYEANNINGKKVRLKLDGTSMQSKRALKLMYFNCLEVVISTQEFNKLL